VFPSLDAHQQIKREFYSYRVEIDIEGRSKVIVAASVTVSLSASMHNGYFPRAHCSRLLTYSTSSSSSSSKSFHKRRASSKNNDAHTQLREKPTQNRVSRKTESGGY
jgi:hypothetical protein